MRPLGFGCQDHTHPHQVIVGGRRVTGLDDELVGILTLWRCPIVGGVGGYWHDARRDPRSITKRGGPLP